MHVGTLGLVLEPMAGALEAVVARFSERALVMVDPNCRPTVLSDAAGYRARLRRVFAGTHVVKVSEEDLAWLSPGIAAEGAARALLAQGPAVVLLTRGGDGATALTARESIEVAAPPTTVVDTIGAGDAFSGGFLGLVVGARPRRRRARRPRRRARGDDVRLPGRGAHVRAAGRLAALAARAGLNAGGSARGSPSKATAWVAS